MEIGYREECKNCAERYKHLGVHHCGYGSLRIHHKTIELAVRPCQDFALKPLPWWKRYLPWTARQVCDWCDGRGFVLTYDGREELISTCCTVCGGGGRR